VKDGEIAGFAKTAERSGTKMKNRAERREQIKRVIKKRIKIIKSAFGTPSKLIEQPHRLAKKHPFDCGNPKCFLCHSDKLLKNKKISDLKHIDQSELKNLGDI